MSEQVVELLNKADLDIIEYNIDRRRRMSNLNRIFPFYVMSYLQSGEACLSVDGAVYRTGPGSIILVPPNTNHHHYKDDSNETVFLWWHFNFSVASVVDAVKLLKLPLVSSISHRERFEQAFYRLYNNRQLNSLSNLLMHRAWGLELMALLIDDLVSEHHIHMEIDIPDVFLAIFHEITDLNLNQPAISLKYLSHKYHLNANYISTRFKSYFGMTPIAMRRQLVFEHSRQMLLNTSMSIGEIADGLGFDSVFSFTHFFTTRAGISPSGFRNSVKMGR